MTKRSLIGWGIAAAILLLALDHAMRVDQHNLCHRGDNVTCPDGLWLWSSLS